MKILLASSEVHPFSKTGGLADMVGALGKALAHAPATRLRIVTPLYRGIREKFPASNAWTGNSICRWAKRRAGGIVVAGS
jgi:glycogen synthase